MSLIKDFFLMSFVIALVCTSCSKSSSPVIPTPTPKLSSLTVVDVAHMRDNKQVISFRFFINVSPASDKDIKVNYATADGSAISGADYTAVTGTLTIPASSTVGYVDVFVTGDSLRQPDQAFTLILSSPVNATIAGTGKATGTITNSGTFYPSDGEGYFSPSTYPGYTFNME